MDEPKPETKDLQDDALIWASRRGMLELDLILLKYVKDQVAKLDDRHRIMLWKLLKEEDAWLYDSLVYRKIDPSDPHLEIIKLIWNYADSA